eukprot:7170913-Pyramimonas_sp.AAC.1
MLARGRSGPLAGDDQRQPLEPVRFASGGFLPASSAAPATATSATPRAPPSEPRSESGPGLPAQTSDPEPFDDYEAEDFVAAELYS